jgi:hypothetical protein
MFSQEQSLLGKVPSYRRAYHKDQLGRMSTIPLNKLPFGKKRWLLKHATKALIAWKNGEKLRGNTENDECPHEPAQPALYDRRSQRHRYRHYFFRNHPVQKLEEITMGDKFTAQVRTAIWHAHSSMAQVLERSDNQPGHSFLHIRRSDEFGTKYAVERARPNKHLNHTDRLFMMDGRSTKYLESLGKHLQLGVDGLSQLSANFGSAWDMWQHRNHIIQPPTPKQEEMDRIGETVNACMRRIVGTTRSR